MDKLKRIPISAAKDVATKYGYDQVIILARRCHDTPEPQGSWATTYGRNKQHCKAASIIGKAFLDLEADKYKLVKKTKPLPEALYEAYAKIIDDSPFIEYQKQDTDTKAFWQKIARLLKDKYHHTDDRVDCACYIYNWKYHTFDFTALMKTDASTINRWLKIGQIAKFNLQEEDEGYDNS